MHDVANANFNQTLDTQCWYLTSIKNSEVKQFIFLNETCYESLYHIGFTLEGKHVILLHVKFVKFHFSLE